MTSSTSDVRPLFTLLFIVYSILEDIPIKSFFILHGVCLLIMAQGNPPIQKQLIPVSIVNCVSFKTNQ